MTPRILINVIAFLSCGCTVQLASSYDANIDMNAQAFEKSFLMFALERAGNTSQAPGVFGRYAASYTDFQVSIAIMSLRAASDPGGVSCGEAVAIAGRYGISMAGPAPQASASPGPSCISLEVAELHRQIDRLQRNDAERCGPPNGTPDKCATLFPNGSVDDLLPAGRGDATLVRATLVSIESLVGFEQDLRPTASPGGSR